MKLKKLSFTNLENDSLKDVVWFSAHNTDKVIVDVKDFDIDEVKRKMSSMWRVLKRLGDILYEDKEVIFSDYVSWSEDEKYWINISFKDEEIESIEANDKVVYEVINVLYMILEREGGNCIDEILYDKVDEIYKFRLLYGEGKSYFNKNLKVEVNSTN